ncbi:RecB family exonuclease [Jatrophihabitans sp. YIM 134969]
MPEPLLRCTPTRLATFACPRRYRLTYLDRPSPPSGGPWAANTVGAAVHVALARFWERPAADRTPANGAELTVDAWQHDGFRDLDQSLTWRTRAAGWVRDYLERALYGRPATLDAEHPPVGVERTVGTHTDVLAVSGRLDRLDDRDGHLVVVDYKTGRHVPTEADAAASPALALYALGTARRLRRPCRTVELHHLPSATIARADHSDASLADHVRRADATGRQILAATADLTAGADPDRTFPTVTGSWCSTCDMRRHCPDGQRAAPAVPSWSGLAEPAA